MRSESRSEFPLRMLWFTLFAGATAWSAQLLVDYVLVGLRCATGAPAFSWSVNAFSVLMALTTALAIVVGFRAWKATGVGLDAEDPVNASLGRAALMGIGGTLFD